MTVAENEYIIRKNGGEYIISIEGAYNNKYCHLTVVKISSDNNIEVFLPAVIDIFDDKNELIKRIKTGGYGQYIIGSTVPLGLINGKTAKIQLLDGDEILNDDICIKIEIVNMNNYEQEKLADKFKVGTVYVPADSGYNKINIDDGALSLNEYSIKKIINDNLKDIVVSQILQNYFSPNAPIYFKPTNNGIEIGINLANNGNIFCAGNENPYLSTYDYQMSASENIINFKRTEGMNGSNKIIGSIQYDEANGELKSIIDNNGNSEITTLCKFKLINGVNTIMEKPSESSNSEPGSEVILEPLNCGDINNFIYIENGEFKEAPIFNRGLQLVGLNEKDEPTSGWNLILKQGDSDTFTIKLEKKKIHHHHEFITGTIENLKNDLDGILNIVQEQQDEGAKKYNLAINQNFYGTIFHGGRVFAKNADSAAIDSIMINNVLETDIITIDKIVEDGEEVVIKDIIRNGETILGNSFNWLTNQNDDPKKYINATKAN